ncbi:MAG: c-type cytochrome [Comamonas sp.]|nr:c-type cytochrome [Comamonas sp.]
MKKLPFAVAISAALLLAACGKEAPQASAPAAEAPKVEAPAAPAAEAPKVEAPAAAAAPAAEAPKAEATASVDGKSVYGKTCAMCHAAGVAGAPKPGDKEAWAPRIAQGNDTMYKHAIEGFTGDHGMMPARGGSSKLTDEEVKAAVDFMVGQSV